MSFRTIFAKAMEDAKVQIVGTKWYTVHAHGKAAVMVVSLDNAEAPRVPRYLDLEYCA